MDGSCMLWDYDCRCQNDFAFDSSPTHGSQWRCQRLGSSMSSDTVPGHPSMVMTSCGTLRDGFTAVKQELEDEEKRLTAELDDFQLHYICWINGSNTLSWFHIQIESLCWPIEEIAGALKEVDDLEAVPRVGATGEKSLEAFQLIVLSSYGFWEAQSCFYTIKASWLFCKSFHGFLCRG